MIICLLLLLAGAPVENQGPITIPAQFGEMAALDQRAWKAHCKELNVALDALFEVARDTSRVDGPVVPLPSNTFDMSRAQELAWRAHVRQVNGILATAFQALRDGSLAEAPELLTPPGNSSELSLFDRRIWEQQDAKFNRAIKAFYERVRQ